MDNRNQIRSSRRLEVECRRNVELMWLLGRLYPDHKSIAEFRRLTATRQQQALNWCALHAAVDSFVASGSPSMVRSSALWPALTALANGLRYNAILTVWRSR